MTSSPKIFSSTEISQFHDRGYLIADFNLDAELLDCIVAKMQDFYELKFQHNPTFPSRILDGWKLVDEARELATHPSIKQALRELLGREAMPFQTLNFPFGTCQAPHSDTIHFNSIPETYMVGVWVALEDIDKDNGPLVYYPGSHKQPEITMQDLGLEPRAEDYPKYEILMRKLVKKNKLTPEYGLIKKGQAIIWHANLLHGGEGHWNLKKSRHSQVTHYFFEDCQYYTPMLSTPAQPHMRNPIWIPTKYDEEIAHEAQREFRERRKLELEEFEKTSGNRGILSRLFSR